MVAHEADLSALIGELGRLLVGTGAQAPFGEEYRAALQESPDVVLAHRDVTALINPRRRTGDGSPGAVTS
jgi:hypothetical protein